MALTQAEKTELLNAIKAESQSVDELTQVTSIDGTVLLLAIRDTEAVVIPVSLLCEVAGGADNDELERTLIQLTQNLTTFSSLAVYHYDYNAEPDDSAISDTMAAAGAGAVVWLPQKKRFAYRIGDTYFLQWNGMTHYMVLRDDGWKVRRNFYGNMSLKHVVYIESDGVMTDIHQTLQDNIDAVLSALNTEKTTRGEADTALESKIANLSEALENESSARSNAENAIIYSINSEQKSRMAADAAIRQSVGDVTKDINGLSGRLTATGIDITNEVAARKAADNALQSAIDSKLHVVEFDGIVRFATLEDTLGSISDPDADTFIVSWVEAAGRFCLQEDDGGLYNNAMPFDMLAPYYASQTAPARDAIFRDRTTGISYLVAGDGPRQSLIPLSPVTGYHALPFHGTAPANITIEPAGLGDSTGGKVMLRDGGSFVLCVGDLVKKYYSVWGGCEDGTVAPSSEYNYNGTQQAVAGKYYFSTSDSRLYRLDQRSFAVDVVGGDDGIVDPVTAMPLIVNGATYRCRPDGTWVDVMGVISSLSAPAAQANTDISND